MNTNKFKVILSNTWVKSILLTFLGTIFYLIRTEFIGKTASSQNDLNHIEVAVGIFLILLIYQAMSNILPNSSYSYEEGHYPFSYANNEVCDILKLSTNNFRIRFKQPMRIPPSIFIEQWKTKHGSTNGRNIIMTNISIVSFNLKFSELNDELVEFKFIADARAFEPDSILGKVFERNS